MDKERDILQRIEALPQPRHLFVLPKWADPGTLDRLSGDGYIHSNYQQRDEQGQLVLAMNLQLTPKGNRLLKPASNWPRLAFTGSLAGVSFAGISLIILYLG
jgi:hypothetical protein